MENKRNNIKQTNKQTNKQTTTTTTTTTKNTYPGGKQFAFRLRKVHRNGPATQIGRIHEAQKNILFEMAILPDQRIYISITPPGAQNF